MFTNCFSLIRESLHSCIKRLPCYTPTTDIYTIAYTADRVKLIRESSSTPSYLSLCCCKKTAEKKEEEDINIDQENSLIKSTQEENNINLDQENLPTKSTIAEELVMRVNKLEETTNYLFPEINLNNPEVTVSKVNEVEQTSTQNHSIA